MSNNYFKPPDDDSNSKKLLHMITRYADVNRLESRPLQLGPDELGLDPGQWPRWAHSIAGHALENRDLDGAQEIVDFVLAYMTTETAA